MLISFQIFTTNAQVQSQFLNKSYITPIENLVSWDYQELESLDNQQNVKITNDYSNEIMCPYYEKCQGDYLCQQQVEAYYFDDPNQIDLAYDALQYISFSNPQLYLWSSLTELQKQKLIKHFIFKSVQQSISYNSRFLDVQSKAIYINFEDDGIMIFNNYQISLQFTSIDNSYFGGPFDCTRVNGQFKKYKFTNVDQFEGFYKKDLNNVSCIQPGSDECQCSYYNAKRLFPVEWRCRPWYIIGAQNYMTYTNPYIDAFTGATMASATIRLLNQTNLNQGIDFEFIPQINNTLLAVFGIDINLQKLQLNIQLQSSQNEYSYIIAPSQPVPLQPQLYNEYQAISHPQISPNDTNILDLEFSNSTNKQQEVEQYMQQLGSIFTNRIYQFNVLIDSGNIKTQYELKVVLQAINQAVLSFKSQIAKQIDDLQKCNIQRQIEIYQRAVQDFTIFQNKQGLALCYNNLSNLSVQCNQLQEGIVYSQQCNLISEQMYNQIKQKYLLGQSDQQKLSNICMDQSFQGFMKLHACRKYTLAKLLIKFIVSQKGTQKNQVYLDLYQKMKNLVPQNQIVNSNEKIEVNQFGFNSMSLQYQQKISTQLKQSNFLKESEQNLFASREQFFSQRRYQIDQESNMNQNLISEYSVKIQDKKFILSQACELLYECRFIMKKIAESNKSRNQIKVIKGFTVQILALQELVQCHNLMKNRYVVIKEIIKAIKTELEQLEIIIQRKNNYKHILIPFQILIQKYYTIQGQYYLKKKKYPKSLRNYLKGLNYIQNQDSQQICNDTNKYDVFNTIDCLKGIQKIININQIPLDSNQKAYLDQDFQNLTLQSQEKYNLYFEEAFFDQHQLKKVTIIQQQDSLESYFEQTYKNYIQITALSQSKQTIFSFQQETTSIQMIGNFNKQMILNANNFNNIVNWEDQFLERGNYGDGKYNFLISNEYVLDDYCNLLHKECQDYDLQCINLFSQRQKQFIPNLTEMMYKQYQYQSWSSALQMQWEQLAQDQQIKIILTSLSASITKALTVNSKVKEIGVESYYIAFQSDGIFLSNELGLRIQEIDILNQPYYDGPFNCTKNSNGQYNKYKFTDPSQFNGFQFMDNNGNLCKGGICSCQYYNIKRLVPLDWRCRPWFYSSYKEYQITFSAPYSDLSTNSSDTTITYKITQNQNDYNIKQEKNMETIAVQSVDLDLSQVKLRLSKNQNNTLEYSYIVSPKTFNYDENQGYYQLLAMIHPLSNGTIQNITDIEFQNSTNKEQEVNEYLQNVNFMLNTEIRGLGSGKILQNESTFKTIKKNGQNYLTYFSTLRVSYGNLYTQENIIFGYLARVISTEIKIYRKLNEYDIDNWCNLREQFCGDNDQNCFNQFYQETESLSPYENQIAYSQYSKFKFTDPEQFDGFQFKDKDGETYSEPYTDIVSYTLDTTITYKITDNKNPKDIQLERQMPTIAVQSIDTDLSQVQNRLSSSYNISQEYSYIISAKTFNYEQNSGYYEYLTLTHPLINGTVKSILDLEFVNSTNKQQEISDYINQTSFIQNTNLRSFGCQQIHYSDNQFRKIIKNGQEYLTYFQTLRVCYGNLYDQESIIFGYIARAFSTDLIKQQLAIVTQTFKPIQTKILITYLLCFIFNAILLSYLLLYLLKFNFDIPISIVNQFISRAQTYEIHQFSESIKQKKIKTQHELQNLIFAIESVISFVQIQIQQLHKDKNDIQQNDLIKIYQEALTNFQILDNLTGVGICYNNISNLYLSLQDYEKSIQAMKSALLTIEILLSSKKKKTQKSPIEMAQKIKHKNIIKIYASRNFQLANLLLRYLKKNNSDNKQTLHHLPLDDHNLDIENSLNLCHSRFQDIPCLKQQENLSLEISFSQNIFQSASRENFFSRKFFTKCQNFQWYNHSQNIILNESKLQIKDTKNKIIIAQAIDLLWEAQKIFNLLAQTYQKSEDLQDNLESYFDQTYKNYIAIVNLSEQKQTISSFQQSTTYQQIIALFNKNMVLNTDNFTQIIAWEDFYLDQKSYPDGKYNFLISNEFIIDNYCSLIQKNCPLNETNCQKELDNYLQNDLDSDQSDLIYQTGQYSSWSSSQQFKWEELTDQQKMKIILVNFSASISKSFLANLFLTEIEIFAFYIAFQQDGIFVQNEFNMRLNQIDLINNPDFGGPFNCTQDFQGKYSQYRYSDPSQFDGFQYMDTDGERCTGSCSCEYFNVKRLFPIEWRCRPWFISSQKEYQITFSEPYSDLSTNASDTTITYKITDNINIMNLTQEQKMIPIAVQSIDLDLRKIKQRLSLNKDFSLEYSYIVAPKTFDYDDNQGYYQLLAMTHPLNNGTVQSILDIEFQNSTNRQEEINKYLTQVQFMLNTNIRQPGCNSIFQTQNVLETIIRNGQEYLTYFSTLRVCYGNLYTQENLIIGYLAKAISTEIIQSQADIVIKAFQPMINQFSERISQGQIKTQQELKNLIFAINSVITFVESQIQSLLRDQKEIQENDLIQIYLKAQKNFETFENFTGIGICYNNISNLHRLLKEQQLSIEFMQKAILNIEHQLLQIKKEQFIELQDMYQKKKYKSILKIYASRNFSLANLLIECCKNQQQITSKNKLDEVINNFQMINNLTNQNTNFDEQYPLNLQNLSNQQPVAQNSNQLINRDKFYSIKYFYKNQQTCKRQSKQFQFGDFQQQNKNILVQAIDLLWEAQQIFNNLSDLYFYSRDIDECRFCNIICILLIIEASRLMQKKGCLINEMLKKCKNLIVYYKQFPSFRLHPLYDIVWNQYFFQKAVLNRQLHKLEKSLKYCLKSLGFRDNISSSSLQEQISYDYQDVHESLTFLSQLLEECDITLTPNQQEIIKYDLNYFKSASIQNEIRNQAKWIQQINLNLVTLLSSQRIALVNVMYINTQILFKFHGFQYMNSDRDECNGQCSCKYFNMKRLFRLYRRWRPWFLAIFQYVLDWFSNSFSDNTITYKLIDNLDMMNMTQEEILMDSNTTLIFQQIYLFHSQISQTS
ncbi:hypothetical protein ABPG74_016306 [Tetrahymena malaccensis]